MKVFQKQYKGEGHGVKSKARQDSNDVDQVVDCLGNNALLQTSKLGRKFVSEESHPFHMQSSN